MKCKARPKAALSLPGSIFKIKMDFDLNDAALSTHSLKKLEKRLIPETAEFKQAVLFINFL